MNDIDFNYKKILPNTITMMALGFGLSSLNMAYWGRFEMAIIFITLASIFDFMDGKVARFLGVSSKFGEELDSLSDFVCFGVVPGIVMYFWTMDDMKKIEVFQNAVHQSEAVGVHWAVVLFLAMSCATRLARFNAMISEKRPPYWKHFFTGVPAPAGGGIAILPLILWLVTKADIFKSPVLVSCFLIFSGVMMASRLPTFCLKHIRIQKRSIHLLRIFLLLLICCLIGFPWVVLSFVGLAYLISLPVGFYFFLKWRKMYHATHKS